MDRIDLTPAFRTVDINKDIKLRGHVTWAGKSSMETTTDVTQLDDSGNEIKMLGRLSSMWGRGLIKFPLTPTQNSLSIETRWSFKQISSPKCMVNCEGNDLLSVQD